MKNTQPTAEQGYQKIKDALNSPPYQFYKNTRDISSTVKGLCNNKPFCESAGIPYNNITQKDSALIRSALQAV